MTEGEIITERRRRDMSMVNEPLAKPAPLGAACNFCEDILRRNLSLHVAPLELSSLFHSRTINMPPLAGLSFPGRSVQRT